MENNLTFIDTKHEEFYEKHGAEGDSYKKSFVYLIGLVVQKKLAISYILFLTHFNQPHNYFTMVALSAKELRHLSK